MNETDHAVRHREIDIELAGIHAAVGIGRWITTVLLAAIPIAVGIWISRGGQP